MRRKHIGVRDGSTDKVLLRNRKSCNVADSFGKKKGRAIEPDLSGSFWYTNKREQERICKKKYNNTQILLINNRVSEQTKHFTMESLILAQDER